MCLSMPCKANEIARRIPSVRSTSSTCFAEISAQRALAARNSALGASGSTLSLRPTADCPIPVIAAFRSSGHHSFWPDETSLCEDGLYDPTHIAGSRQLTDVYLLGLSVYRGGCLATFDGRMRRESVRGASPEHLVLIGDSRGANCASGSDGAVGDEERHHVDERGSEEE